MIPVLISGGSGTRLWPVSRTQWPKQFCDLFEQSLQTLSLKRVSRLGNPWIVTSETLRDITEKKLKELGHRKTRVLYEPEAKNTAPALAYLCKSLALEGLENEVIGVFPADHLIENEEEFIKAVSLAAREAQEGFLVTLGIRPHSAATGFGYIETLRELSSGESGMNSYKVHRFIEKPNDKKAREFLRKGNYYWNAGMFIFRVQTFLDLLKTHAPDLWTVVNQLKADRSNAGEVYRQFRNISIDYALIEKLNQDTLRCIPCDIGWNDIGSWDAMADLKDFEKAPRARVDCNSENNFLHPLPEKSYAFVGVEDLIVVDTPDALLISQKGASQDVRVAVEKMKLAAPEVVQEHVFEERPWGDFEILKNTEIYKTKIIRVLPSSQISYQSHARREEHWLITQGQGEVILEDKTIPVQAGTYVHIPLGAKHRIRNTGLDTIEFIEVQLGEYFGEDDIVRYKDDYKRV